MKSGLWRPQQEDDEAFAERSRRAALPVATALLFAAVALLLWACWTLSEMFLT
jgi:hypothetical protein